MPVQQEPVNLGDLLKYEASHYYSRDTAVVAAGQQLNVGTVVSQDSNTGKWYALDPSGNDGVEIAAGILAVDVNAVTSDFDEAIVIARHAIVSSAEVVWPASITANEKTTAIEELKALGVLIRVAA